MIKHFGFFTVLHTSRLRFLTFASSCDRFYLLLVSWSKMIWSRVIFCLFYRKHHFCVSYKRPPWKKRVTKNIYIYLSPQQQNVPPLIRSFTKIPKNIFEYLPAIEWPRTLITTETNIVCGWCSNSGSFSGPPTFFYHFKHINTVHPVAAWKLKTMKSNKN